jgi:acetyltransferase
MKGLIESFDVFDKILFADWKLVKKHKDLSDFGFPCFLKVDVSEGEHKTEIGAVVESFSLRDAEEKLIDLHRRFPDRKILVQKKVEGIEMILGVKRDDVFGKVLGIGFGGTSAEVRGDISFRVLPVSLRDVKEMISDLEGFKIFSARGKKYNLNKFYSLIEKVLRIVEKENISEMDLNPVIVGEKRSWIVDARVE